MNQQFFSTTTVIIVVGTAKDLRKQFCIAYGNFRLFQITDHQYDLLTYFLFLKI